MGLDAGDMYGEATALLQEMMSLALEYQAHVRAPDAVVDTRLAVAARYRNLVHRNLHSVALRLQIAGHDAAAWSMISYGEATRFVTYMEYSWEDPDFESVSDATPSALTADVKASGGEAISEIDRAQKRHLSSGTKSSELRRIDVLKDAALVMQRLFWIGSDFLTYLEGWLPIGHDEDETDADRLIKEVKKLEDIETQSLIDALYVENLPAVAEWVSQVRRTVGRIVQFDDEFGETSRNLSIAYATEVLDSTYRDAIDALLKLRPRVDGPDLSHRRAGAIDDEGTY